VFSWTNRFESATFLPAGFWVLKIEAARSAAAGCIARPTLRNWSFHTDSYARGYNPVRQGRGFRNLRRSNDMLGRLELSMNRRESRLENRFAVDSETRPARPAGADESRIGHTDERKNRLEVRLCGDQSRGRVCHRRRDAPFLDPGRNSGRSNRQPSHFLRRRGRSSSAGFLHYFSLDFAYKTYTVEVLPL
jgi:hypothetical protein